MFDLLLLLSEGRTMFFGAASHAVRAASALVLQTPCCGWCRPSSHMAQSWRTLQCLMMYADAVMTCADHSSCRASDRLVELLTEPTLQTTYFGALGLECLPEYNPADFFLDVVSMDYRTPEAEAECRERVRLLAEVYFQSQGSQHVRAHAAASRPEVCRDCCAMEVSRMDGTRPSALDVNCSPAALPQEINRADRPAGSTYPEDANSALE